MLWLFQTLIELNYNPLHVFYQWKMCRIFGDHHQNTMKTEKKIQKIARTHLYQQSIFVWRTKWIMCSVCHTKLSNKCITFIFRYVLLHCQFWAILCGRHHHILRLRRQQPFACLPACIYIDRLITLNRTSIYTCQIRVCVWSIGVDAQPSCWASDCVSRNIWWAVCGKEANHSCKARCRFYLKFDVSRMAPVIYHVHKSTCIISTWLSFFFLSISSNDCFLSCFTPFQSVFFPRLSSDFIFFVGWSYRCGNIVNSRIFECKPVAMQVNSKPLFEYSLGFFSIILLFSYCQCTYSKRQISMFTWDAKSTFDKHTEKKNNRNSSNANFTICFYPQVVGAHAKRL